MEIFWFSFVIGGSLAAIYFIRGDKIAVFLICIGLIAFTAVTFPRFTTKQESKQEHPDCVQINSNTYICTKKTT